MKLKKSAPVSIGPEEETIRLEAELFNRRRRSGMLRRLKPWLLAAAGLIVVGVLGWLVWFSPYLLAERVSVSGVKVLHPPQVIARADVPKVPLISVDIDKIRAAVAKLPPVKSVEVSRSWPHTIKIDITERTAIAVVPRGTQFAGMDESGVLFRDYLTKPAKLPLIADSASADREAREEAAHVVGSLSPALWSRVESVEVTSIDGITLVMRNGQRVVWGRASDSEAKAEVLEILIKRPGVKVIDVSVAGRPTTRS